MSASHKFLRHRRRYTVDRLLVTVCIVTFGILGTLLFLGPVPGVSDLTAPRHRRNAPAQNVTDATPNVTAGSLYPPDAFTMDQLKQGAVVLYILGIIYMFVALAIVCDEFFVPSLEVIIQVLGISEDVAGATFMAAGGSAPELFTSFIGVFIARSDVGIGTIVGSAVFNILFVIGMCAMFSLSVLVLTWWPLFRDVSFYSISLICLILFFRDQKIEWWEALVLLLCYALYVIFMKFNSKIEYWVMSKTKRNRVNSTAARSTDNLISAVETPEKETGQVPGLKASSAKFRHGVLQLMIHTIDPLGEAKVHDKALKLHAIASIKSVNGENHNNPNEQNQNANNTAGNRNGSIPAISNGVLMQNGGGGGGEGDEKTHSRNSSQQTAITTTTGSQEYQMTPGMFDADRQSISVAVGNNQDPQSPVSNGDTKSQAGNLEENEPLDLSWPDTPRRRLTYLLVAPLIFPLWLTLPDVRRMDRRKFFPWTFLGSILWIAVFAFFMNWWASTTGRVIGIPDAVMGLTFLAAGTSIPDLITSVIVAKKGYGDMAVSSSVGSNIFDVTVGLPLPWVLFAAIYGEPYRVDSKGLFCSIILLFLMLLFVIISIAAFKWRMNKALGGTMFFMYAIFLMISLLLEYSIIRCPVESS